MESVQSAGGGLDFHYKSVECRSSGHAKKVKAEEIDKATHGSSEGGSEEIEVSRSHQGGVSPRVVI